MSFSTRIRTWFSPEAVKRAQTAEARGELDSASALYVQSARYADAVRVTLIRAQGELDPHRRALLLAQATALAPQGDPARLQAWRVRAGFILDRVEAGALDPSIRRRELLDAGKALRELGDPELAARALRIAGDLDGEVAALAEAGAIGALEDAVARQRKVEETRAKRLTRFEDARDLLSVGRRRDAVELLQAALKEEQADDLHALLQGILSRKPRLPATISLGAGKMIELVPGNPVVLGRTEGDLKVSAPVVSRRHLQVFRSEEDDLWVKDLGGKNGTTLRGARVELLPVSGGLDLLIGGALPLQIRPDERGGVQIELPGRVVWLPLGNLHLGGMRAQVSHSPDGWLELSLLRGTSTVLSDLRVDGTIQLLTGDEIFDGHDGPLLLRV